MSKEKLLRPNQIPKNTPVYGFRFHPYGDDLIMPHLGMIMNDTFVRLENDGVTPKMMGQVSMYDLFYALSAEDAVEAYNYLIDCRIRRLDKIKEYMERCKVKLKEE